MSKKILVNAAHTEENRVAIVEDGILTELDIEVAGHEPTKGNIYKAVVVRVETGLQAAFVDYGAERLGFLQIDEINYKTVKPDYNPDQDARRPHINDLLHRGQELLVQITKEERGTKGAALTTYISLAGRFMVLMPGSQTRGVSRKAESDSQRKALKKAMSSIDLAEGVGYIVRTAALDQSREELDRDYRYLLRLYENITALAAKAKAPALIYKESNLIIRSIRDYFTTDMDEVLIDDPEVFREARDFFQMVMPDHVRLVKQHQERRPIFSRYQIEDQIEILNGNKVPLPSGGSIVIDPTEALVAIDVNSGKMSSEQNVEATATKSNLEAAAEVGRQLRLRDLGGLIVIDFIDMRERKHIRQVENELKQSLANDKARVSIGRISQFGLLEMSRQRIKAALTEGTFLTCPHCNGSGHLKSPESQAVALLRRIHASAAKGQISRVDAQLPIDVAAYLLNHKREELVELEHRYNLQILLHGNRDYLADQLEIETSKREKEKSAKQEYVAAALLPMPAASPAAESAGETSDDDAERKPQSAEAESADNAPETGRKRRRRRRRRSSNRSGDQATVQGESPAAEADSESDQESSAETTDAAAAEAEQESQKPKRSRRSRGRKKPASESTETSDSAEIATESSDEERAPQERAPQADKVKDVAPASEPETQEAGQKPKRGRRRATAASKLTEESPTGAAEATAAQPTDKSAAEASQKPKRTRRTSAGEKASEPTEAPAPETSAVAAGGDDTEPAKPKRRGRGQSSATQRKDSVAPAGNAQAGTADDGAAASGQGKPAQKTAESAEEKPKPRSTRSSKAKSEAKVAAAATVSAAEEAAEAANPAEQKPKRRAPAKRSRKPATAKAADSATAAVTEEPAEQRLAVKPSAQAKDTVDDTAEDTEEKPKRRRAPRKKPAASTSEAEPPLPERPKEA
jgi:ribonuclease E